MLTVKQDDARKCLRSPSSSDPHMLARMFSMPHDGPESIMTGEEYAQSRSNAAASAANSHPVMIMIMIMNVNIIYTARSH